MSAMSHEVKHVTFQAIGNDGKEYTIHCRKDYVDGTLLGDAQYFTSDAQIVKEIDHQRFEIGHTGIILTKLGEEE